MIVKNQYIKLFIFFLLATILYVFTIKQVILATIILVILFIIIVFIADLIPAKEMREAKGDPEKLYLYGNKLLLNEYYSEAKKAAKIFKKVTDIDPNHKDAYVQLGSLLFELKKPEEALKAFKRAQELGVDEIETWFFIGECYLLINDPENAISSYEYALKADGNELDDPCLVTDYHVRSLRGMGEGYLRLGKLDRALQSFKNILDIENTERSGDVLAKIAEIEFKHGNYSEVIKTGRLAIPHLYLTDKTRLLIARAICHTQEPEKALDELEKMDFCEISTRELFKYREFDQFRDSDRFKILTG